MGGTSGKKAVSVGKQSVNQNIAEVSTKICKKDGTPYHPTYLENQRKAALAENAAQKTLGRVGMRVCRVRWLETMDLMVFLFYGVQIQAM